MTLMDRTRAGPTAWTYPAAIVLGIATAGAWVLYAVLTRQLVPACELLPRTAWAFATGAGVAVFLWPWSYAVPGPVKAAAAVALAAIVAALAFWGTAALFPRFC
jgi:drug/metabolite transporter (DMT)-like permease